MEENDNWDYFYDIALGGGLYISTDDNSFPPGTVISLSGSYFLNDKIGFRSGVSYITQLEGSNEYLKIPLLVAFRTASFRYDWLDQTEPENLGEFFTHFLLTIIPTRFEINAGPSLGYMTPNPVSTYTYQIGKEVLLETSEINQRFASSLEANFRISYQIWRICLTGNLGINYLWTKNYNHQVFRPTENSNTKPSWFANLSFGGSFRF
jgi:hypothetical protein